MSQSNAQPTDDQQPEEARRGGRPPVDKFQEGPFQVSIWQNASSKGDFRTATMDRRYKDKEGQFQTSPIRPPTSNTWRRLPARPASASRAGRKKTACPKASRARFHEGEQGPLGNWWPLFLTAARSFTPRFLHRADRADVLGMAPQLVILRISI
jgi:hypothetical protein